MRQFGGMMRFQLPKILGLIVALGLSASASAQMMINGAGATFPYPIYSKWFDEYAKVDPSVRFNYQSIGSGGGQKQILAQTVDFGASDGPMSDENLSKAPGKILHIDRKSTRLNSSHGYISYAVFCLKKKKNKELTQ